MRKPVIIGMNNPYSQRLEHALYPHPPGSSGHRLWSMMADATGGIEDPHEIGEEEYIDTFERMNLVRGEWEDGLAGSKAAQLYRKDGYDDRMVVLLGDRVVKAFQRAGLDMSETPLFTWRKVGLLGLWARIPHPSGRARTWFTEEAKVAAPVFLRDLVDKARNADSQRREHADFLARTKET